jgi:hypothetical protein
MECSARRMLITGKRAMSVMILWATQNQSDELRMESIYGQRRGVVDFVAVPRQKSIRAENRQVLTVKRCCPWQNSGAGGQFRITENHQNRRLVNFGHNFPARILKVRSE